jgi:hypothetical protein
MVGAQDTGTGDGILPVQVGRLRVPAHPVQRVGEVVAAAQGVGMTAMCPRSGPATDDTRVIAQGRPGSRPRRGGSHLAALSE